MNSNEYEADVYQIGADNFAVFCKICEVITHLSEGKLQYFGLADGPRMMLQAYCKKLECEILVSDVAVHFTTRNHNIRYEVYRGNSLHQAGDKLIEHIKKILKV